MTSGEMSMSCQLYPSSLEEQDNIMLQSCLGSDLHFWRRKGFFGCYLERSTLSCCSGVSVFPSRRAPREGIEEKVPEDISGKHSNSGLLPQRNSRSQHVPSEVLHRINILKTATAESTGRAAPECPQGRGSGTESCGWSCEWPQPKLCWAGQGKL